MHVQRERNSPSTGSRHLRRLSAHTAAVSVSVWNAATPSSWRAAARCRGLASTASWPAGARASLRLRAGRGWGEVGVQRVCSARALPRVSQTYLLGRAAGDCCTRRCYHVTSCPATSCPATSSCYKLLLPAALPKRYLELLGIACALHGPRIRAGRGAGRGSALTPQSHDICRRARRPCFSSPAASTLRRPCFSLSS